MYYHLYNLYVWLIAGGGKILVENWKWWENWRVCDLPVATQMVAAYIENQWIPRIMYKILGVGVIKKLGNERPSTFQIEL